MCHNQTLNLEKMFCVTTRYLHVYSRQEESILSNSLCPMMKDWRRRKTDKYQDLHKEMSLCGFNVTLKTIEVGSRRVLDSSSFSIFKDICSVSNKSIIAPSQFGRRETQRIGPNLRH